jgi:hypothetical protein
MAKCLVKKGEIKRLPERNRAEQELVMEMVRSQGWEYIAKSEWKKIRPAPKTNTNKKTKKSSSK